MNENFISDFIKKLKLAGIASFWNLKGCSESEIKALEDHFGYKLPKIYRNYLRRMGHSSGKLFLGTDVSYKWLFELRNFLQEIFEGDKFDFILPENTFVFSSHQGYIYHFFYVAEGIDDPEVFGYKEGDLFIKKINNSFSKFLLENLEEYK